MRALPLFEWWGSKLTLGRCDLAPRGSKMRLAQTLGHQVGTLQ
jgi:hypothetical protein